MTTPKYNLKNPGVKRIMQEAKELATDSTFEYSAHPLEDNLFEWHFTVRGPKDTEFENGRYHGRILLPNEYPFKPPEIMFLTPNGRFELNKKICLSITGFHPEFWQPAWGIRTVLLAVAGFFPTEAKGAIGGLDYSKAERKKLAKKSMDWSCSICETSMKDALSDTPPEENTVKEELPAFMMSYKKENDPGEEASTKSTPTTVATSEKNTEKVVGDKATKKVDDKTTEKIASGSSTQFVVPANPQVIAPVRAQQQRQQLTTTSNAAPVWLDALIAGLVSFLVVLICRRYIF